MKTLWCWRCRQLMPMLDEAEFAEVSHLYGSPFKAAKVAPRFDTSSLAARFRPVVAAYERLTGVTGCPANAVMHHRLALYGPPCTQCGKPLRTPKAKHCAACGGLRAISS